MRKYCFIYLIFFCGFSCSCNDDYTQDDISEFSNFETTLSILNNDGESIELVFDVGETKAFKEIWDQTLNEGVQVPVGIYNVYVNRYWNTDMSTGPEQIKIE
jgi:hypothetical protein